MRYRFALCTIGLSALLVAAGCTSPAPRRVAVPPRDQAKDYGRVHETEPMKPLPEPERSARLPQPYEDVPLMNQRPPEQRAYLEAYERVGRPRLMIVAMPADKNNNPAGVDYAAIEAVLADWLAAGGQVGMVSPTTATTGPSAQPEADVLVRVQASPMQGSQDVHEARLIAEATNTRGGDSIARAVVDVVTPLEKNRLNEATRFMARKLMDEMTESWNRLSNYMGSSSTTPPTPSATPRSSQPPPQPPAPPAPSLAPSRPAEPATTPAPPTLDLRPALPTTRP